MLGRGYVVWGFIKLAGFQNWFLASSGLKMKGGRTHGLSRVRKSDYLTISKEPKPVSLNSHAFLSEEENTTSFRNFVRLITLKHWTKFACITHSVKINCQNVGSVN